MQIRLNIRTTLLAAAMAMAAGTAWAGDGDLPQGVSVNTAEGGLVLAQSDGKALYRLDIDRIRTRLRAYGGNLLEERCADVCAKYWRPAAAPPGFTPHGDWAVIEHSSVHQLTYKGDPLYTFEGKTFDEMASIPIVPPYMSGYSAPPAYLSNGIPIATIYWHAADYQPAAPKVNAPAGVKMQWSKTTYVFADFRKQTLYAPRSGQLCDGQCDGLKLFPAAFAALPGPDWRPELDKSGVRYWAYRGRPVYQASDDSGQPPESRWQALEPLNSDIPNKSGGAS